MPTTLVIPLLIGIVLIIAAVACAVFASRLPAVIRIASAAIFLSLALFCVYGFIAALEPGEWAIFFRFAYPLLFAFCLAALGRLVFAKNAFQQEEV